MMNQVLVGTNWKMNKTLVEGQIYCKLLADLASGLHPLIDLFVIPPYTALSSLSELLMNRPVRLGAQNMHWLEKGAFTGEISPVMLAELGVDLVELGHSERRRYYNEKDLDLSKKVVSAIEHDLTPLLCVGEHATEKQLSCGPITVERQLRMDLGEINSEQAEKVQIAYEPFWAIGEQGTEADPEYIAIMHAHIRHVLVDLFGEGAGSSVPILFGGSVNAENYLSYLNIPEVNGLFIGRAAWRIDSFREILLGISQWLADQ